MLALRPPAAVMTWGDATVIRKCFSKKNRRQSVIDTHDIENDIPTDIAPQPLQTFACATIPSYWPISKETALPAASSKVLFVMESVVSNTSRRKLLQRHLWLNFVSFWLPSNRYWLCSRVYVSILRFRSIFWALCVISSKQVGPKLSLSHSNK